MAKKKYCPFCGGALGTKSIDDRERQFCLICGKVLYENPIPAVAVLVYDEDGRVLLVKRGVEPGKGKWCLPGGFIEIDETPYETARRELFEETNIDADEFSLVDVLTQDNPIYGKVLLVGFVANRFNGQPKPGDDATRAEFFPLDNLPPIAFASHLEFIKRTRKT